MRKLTLLDWQYFLMILIAGVATAVIVMHLLLPQLVRAEYEPYLLARDGGAPTPALVPNTDPPAMNDMSEWEKFNSLNPESPNYSGQ